VLATVLGVGLVLARSSASAAPGWTSIVARLGAARAAAFARPRRGPAGFDVPGSPAWRQDAAALAQLDASGLSYQHLAITAANVRVRSESGRRAILELRVSTSAYDVVGGPAHREPLSPARTVVLTLQREDGGWRVFAVAPG
jgi:hypothetical protein